MKYAKWLCFAALLCAVAGCGKEKEPPRAEVVFSGESGVEVRHGDRTLGRTPLKIRVNEGTYFFRFTAPGKIGQWRNLQLKRGEQTTVELRLEPQRSGVLLESIPSGAEVIFNGRIAGTTPLVIDDLVPGEYSAEFRLRGYGTRKASWRLEDARPRSVKLNLNSNIGKLEVASKPSKVQLSVNGNVIGATPYSTELEEGKYTIRLEHPGYTPLEQVIAIQSGKTSRVVLELTALPGGIYVTTEPEGAAVSLNGVKRGLTPCRITDIKPGVYELALEKPGFDSISKTLDVTSGFQDEQHFRLQSSTGGVELDIRPAGVTVVLDGVTVGKTELENPESSNTRLIRLNGLSPGAHKLTVFHRFAQPQSRTVEFAVEKGKITRPKSIELWIANCEIKYTDGRQERGALFFENDKIIQFGPEPGIRIQIEKSRLKSIRILPQEP